ncbi:MAG: diheme cytochrome c [Mariprofundaceae bacterium]|nr:diheme cytochrome c [Mariprofundaceae bacterium]
MSLAATAYADDDDHDSFWSFSKDKSGVRAVDHMLYRQNCAECHFAYQPGLLPRRSWQKMMQTSSLADHFGDNAELADADRQSILAYLNTYAADDADYKRSKKMMRSIREHETPLRITQVRYFIEKHDEIPLRMVTGNPQVRSWSNCATCHTTADTGSFEEDDVRILGVGKWEDD